MELLRLQCCTTHCLGHLAFNMASKLQQSFFMFFGTFGVYMQRASLVHWHPHQRQVATTRFWKLVTSDRNVWCLRNTSCSEEVHVAECLVA
eukprot:6285731-Amphidinium_carterae.1